MMRWDLFEVGLFIYGFNVCCIPLSSIDALMSYGCMYAISPYPSFNSLSKVARVLRCDVL